MLTTELSKEIFALSIEQRALESEQARAEERLETVLGRKFELNVRLNFLREMERRMEATT